MSVIKDFKDFIKRGNVLDLAVGIVIGTAFGKIVSSLVSDIIMPPIGVVVGGVDFKDLRVIIKDAVTGPSGKIIHPAVTLNYGNFLQSLFDFLIIAFAVFMVIRVASRLNLNKKDEASEIEKATKEEVVLLTEIRDLLKK
jgi:large conductance mechanosensitive channel